jgi:hypothetical protein
MATYAHIPLRPILLALFAAGKAGCADVRYIVHAKRDYLWPSGIALWALWLFSDGEALCEKEASSQLEIFLGCLR